MPAPELEPNESTKQSQLQRSTEEGISDRDQRGRDASPWRRALPSWVSVLIQVGAFFFCLALYLSAGLEAKMLREAQGSTRSAADEVLYVTDTTTVQMMSLGYRQAAADLIWLRSIQYFAQHILTDRRYPWLGHFAHQIIELDPRFLHVYLWAGGCILYGGEITPERVLASNKIYEAALFRFPNEYEPAYRLGMNYYAEMRVEDPEERQRYQAMGLAYFERAAQVPNAPPLVLDLIRGIAKRMGRQDVLFYALTDELLRVKDPERRLYLERRLAQLSQEMEGKLGDQGQGTPADWISSAQEREEARQALRPYLHPLDYELIFTAPLAPLDWRSLAEVDQAERVFPPPP